MNGTTEILVVDDEKGLRDLLAHELGEKGRVTTAADGEEAVRRLEGCRFDLVITDVKMPKMDGLQVLEAAKKACPDTEVILTTGYGTVETAVAAMKQGAFDFVQKPVDIEELRAHVDRALERGELKAMVAVHAASAGVFRSIRLEDVLPLIVELTRKLLDAGETTLILREDGRLRLAASAGLESEEERRAGLAWAEGLFRERGESPDQVVVDGGPETGGTARVSVVQPLVAGGDLLGLLTATRDGGDRPFGAPALRAMTVFGAQAAQAVLNARMYRKLEVAQSDLLRSEKLKTVGLLAAGVAHEVNNPLTAILTSAQLLMEEGGLSKRQREDIECIHDQTQRCRKIVQDLLKSSRERPAEKDWYPITEILEGTLRLMKRQISSSGVELSREWPDPSPYVLADPSQLQQVFVNLISNALHAMESSPGKKLTVRLERDAERVSIHFEDTGCGIPEGDRAKLFDPFFTTKPLGKGTGLGLSVCDGIVSEHGGGIRVSSGEGGGAVFTVVLPSRLRTERAAVAAAAAT